MIRYWMQKWMNENGTINLEELFTATLHILDDDEDPWAPDLHRPPIEPPNNDNQHSPPPLHPVKKRFRPMKLSEDDEECAPSPSSPPAKKIRSDYPLTEDEDDEHSPPPPPKPTKPSVFLHSTFYFASYPLHSSVSDLT
ncbi:hypothetical protein P692DRAFT_20883418 [Suillus brevipes Sb2]|nr:hypothetical protein P692DRAFT_20883418 [Suillus brevipes Sb2]